MQSNTGVRYNSIQSGVTILGQTCQFQVIAYVEYQVIACQLSGVRCQVSGVKYNCQVPVSDIKCQGSGVKHNMSVSGNSHVGVR